MSEEIDVEHEYAIVHVPSGKVHVSRYKNRGTALTQLEKQVRKSSEETMEYLKDCVVRKYRIEKRTTHEDISLSDVYDFSPDKPAYVKRYNEEECPQCVGSPPPGFKCKTCDDEGMIKKPRAKRVSLDFYARKHRKKGYKTIPQPIKVSETLYKTPDEVEES